MKKKRKKEIRVLCGWLGGKHSKVDPKVMKIVDMDPDIYEELPI